MSRFVAGLTLGLFLWLCGYAWPVATAGYTREAHVASPVLLWRDKKSATIAEIFDIKAADLENPAEIFSNE